MTTPRPPAGAIQERTSMCGYRSAWHLCHLYGVGACTLRYQSRPMRRGCSSGLEHVTVTYIRITYLLTASGKSTELSHIERRRNSTAATRPERLMALRRRHLA